MHDPSSPRPPARVVVVTGLDALSAHGRGAEPASRRITDGEAAFDEVRRFATQGRRVHRAALLPDAGSLLDELTGSVRRACAQAELDGGARAGCPLLLAVHSDEPTPQGPLSRAVAASCGLPAATRLYTTACVAGSTAVADAAALIAAGRLERVVVAAGYLVEPVQYALFDAGRALARDGEVRPFSRDRRGVLLGDGVAAVVLEAEQAAAARGVPALAVLAGWGRAGDAHHVIRPRPDGDGLVRAIGSALRRAAVGAEQVGYVNANANGTALGDSAEAAALHRVFGERVAELPVSSTKGAHGHALEGSALLELVVTVGALRSGRLPVQAGYREADPQCRLDLVLDRPRPSAARYALSLNSAFGGANTALLVGAA
ncbi:3-oxoacyl-[acyl-carrier-protein] synthase II [Kitasatospora sp. MAP12-15]|uniref:beta-ketoacyl synthase N-terminal-like domain-containing protein n=1 Tax=unclassified Kitasatospora TaxID=2633591 RepID=UPI0024749D57|nr:beta-ketoacyl synthase N-terminal-like domain-containing protein [Kitasatospora sp. MAP12-44]MDH6109412.1 3-oxoacyl-[acyl-carrier-protein] synthase II [Kitasatospora sp. MAP12-44]